MDLHGSRGVVLLSPACFIEIWGVQRLAGEGEHMHRWGGGAPALMGRGIACRLALAEGNQINSDLQVDVDALNENEVRQRLKDATKEIKGLRASLVRERETRDLARRILAGQQAPGNAPEIAE